jgi:hypothetical protein
VDRKKKKICFAHYATCIFFFLLFW